MADQENKAMPKKPRDPDLANAEIALKRASQKARENARKTGGPPVVIMWNGEIMEDWDLDRAYPDC